MLSKFSPCVSLLLVAAAAICSLLASISGCSQISGMPIVQIIGEVRMNRKPLVDARVVFIPLALRQPNGKIIEIAFGKTDDEGRFELRTSQARGVLPGEYRVLFFRPASETEPLGPIDVDLAKDESARTGGALETSSMLAAIDRWDSSAKNSATQALTLAGMPQVGDVPIAYNLQSALRLTVKPGAGIIYPKFELEAHPKN